MTKDCIGRVELSRAGGGDLTGKKCWAGSVQCSGSTVWDVALLTVQREEEGPVPILYILLPLLPVLTTAAQAQAEDHQADWELMNSFCGILTNRILEYA